MSYTTTHVLVTIIALELFRDYYLKNNKKFPRYYILVGALASVFPDLEYLFLLSFKERYFLHSIFVPLTFFILGLLAYIINLRYKEFSKRHMNISFISFIFFIFAFGSLTHLILDFIFVDTIRVFYPFSNYEIGLELVSKFPSYLRELILPTLDAFLLFFWILWLQFKLKIYDYF